MAPPDAGPWLAVKREELADGSIMFRFSDKPLSAGEEAELRSDEEIENTVGGYGLVTGRAGQKHVKKYSVTLPTLFLKSNATL